MKQRVRPPTPVRAASRGYLLLTLTTSASTSPIPMMLGSFYYTARFLWKRATPSDNYPRSVF
jgi:hypothetical protein